MGGSNMKEIIVAGGCFWGVEEYYRRLKGIMKTAAGYIDGLTLNPSYQEVCRGSGHAEAVWIQYDESVIELEKILDHFLRIVDPTQKHRQGPDIGIQYRSGVYCFSDSDLGRTLAYFQGRQSDFSRPIQTEVKLATPFYPAETYHQEYLVKNPGGYCHVALHKAKKEELKEEYHDQNPS
jgi:peptide-methionine (S)-S-oxide reductase